MFFKPLPLFLVLLCVSLGLIEFSFSDPSRILSAQSLTPFKFDLSKTVLALKHEQGRADALGYLLKIPKQQLPIIKHHQILQQLRSIILSSTSTLRERLWSIELLKRLMIADQSLVNILDRTQQWTQVSKKRQIDIIVARKSSEVLRSLGRVDLLSKYWQHQDPYVRRMVAASGAAVDHLCTLLNDPWREVRLSAIFGLGKILNQNLFCVMSKVSNQDMVLAIEAVKVLGKASQQDWFQVDHYKTYLQHMNTLAHNSSLDFAIREALLHSLAMWGDELYAQNIINTHLDKKGLIELTTAAVKSLSSLPLKDLQSDLHQKMLKRCMQKSQSIAVRLNCTYTLIQIDILVHHTLTPSIQAFVEEWGDRRGGREKSAMLKRLELYRTHTRTQSIDSIDLAPSLEEEDELGL